MVSGHVGIAFGTRAYDRDASLLWLLAASIAPDALDYALAARHVCHPSGLYTHTLPAIAVTACVFALAARWPTGSWRAAGIVGAMVVAHILADYITGLKLLWAGGPIVGLNLYAWPAVDFVVELPFIAAGWWMLRRAGAAPRWVSSGGMLAALLIVQAASDITSYRKPNACVAPAERGAAGR